MTAAVVSGVSVSEGGPALEPGPAAGHAGANTRPPALRGRPRGDGGHKSACAPGSGWQLKEEAMGRAHSVGCVIPA